MSECGVGCLCVSVSSVGWVWISGMNLLLFWWVGEVEVGISRLVWVDLNIFCSCVCGICCMWNL